MKKPKTTNEHQVDNQVASNKDEVQHQANDKPTSNKDDVVNHPKTATLLGEEVEIKGIATPKAPELSNDFENMVDDAVKTKPEKAQEQNASDATAKAEIAPYTPEKAAGVVLMGLGGTMKLVNKFTEAPIVVEKETQMIFAAMCTPLVLKYGKAIQALLDPENVDLNSTAPEWLAAAAVGVVAVPSWLQVRERNQLKAQNAALLKAGKKAIETGEPQVVEG